MMLAAGVFSYIKASGVKCAVPKAKLNKKAFDSEK